MNKKLLIFLLVSIICLNFISAWDPVLSAGLQRYHNFNDSIEAVKGIYNLTFSNYGTGNPIYNTTDCIIGTCGHSSVSKFYNLTLGPGSNSLEEYLNTTGKEFSLNIWYRMKTVSGYQHDRLMDTNAISGSMYITENHYEQQANWVGSTADFATLSANSWIMFTYIKFANDTATIWNNGVYQVVGTNVWVGKAPILLSIGGSDRYNENSAYIYLDELAIWNRTLSPAEISTLYNGGSAITYEVSSSSTPISINVSLISPLDKSTTNSTSIYFSANATVLNGNFTNATLYIYNGTTLRTNFTTISGTPDYALVNLSMLLTNKNYTWNILFCADNVTGTSCSFSDANFTLNMTQTSLFFNNASSVKSFRITEFIKVNGTSFTLGGVPYRILGANFYYAMDYFTNRTYTDNGELLIGTESDVYEVLNEMQYLGINVIRTWGLMQGGNSGGSNATWNIESKGGHWNLAETGYPGNWNETYFLAFDKFLSECSKRNIRPQITLLNNWEAYGGMQWYLSQSNTSDKTYENATYLNDSWWAWHDQFYNNTQANIYFQNAINYTLNRNNTITGIKYKDDPTIFSWMIANEPRAKTLNHTIIANWCNTTANFIKSQDTNHLVTCGIESLGFNETWGEGSDMISTYNNTSSDYVTFAMNTGQWGYMVERVETSNDNVFMCDVSSSNCNIGNSNVREFWSNGHNYTYNSRWTAGVPFWFPKQTRHSYDNWVEQNVKQANSIGKPVMLQEFVVEQAYSDVTKDDLYIKAISNFYNAGGDGITFWTMNSDSYYRDSDTSNSGNQDDGYGFYLSDNSTLKALSASTIKAFNFTRHNNTGGTSWVTSIDNYKYDFTINPNKLYDITKIDNATLHLNITNGTSYLYSEINSSIVSLNTDYVFSYQFNVADDNFTWYVTLCGDGFCSNSTPETTSLGGDSPIVTLRSPANDSDNSNTVIFKYNVTDTLDISYSELYINGVLNLTDTTVEKDVEQTFTIVFSPITANYSWYVKSVDIGDNEGLSNEWNLTIDTTPPTINIVKPLNGTNFTTNVVAINLSIFDDNLLDSCWSSNDSGVTNDSLTCGNNITGTWNQGWNTIFVYANDSVNNKNQSQVSFFVDSVAPTISYTNSTLVNGTYANQTHIYINVSWVETNFRNITFRISTTEFTSNLNTTFDKDFTGLSDGIYWYNVTICDTLNQCAESSTRNITLDTRAPNATLIAPSNNSYLNYSDVNFTSTFADNIGAANYTINIYNQSGLYNQTTIASTTNPILATWGIVVNLLDNLYTWFYNIIDLAQNSYTSENRTLLIDTIYPTYQYVYPTNASGVNITYENNFRINITANDINLKNISVYLYNSSFNLVNSAINNSANGLYNNFINFNPGTYFYNATICDAVNNCNTTETRNFSISSAAPSVSILYPTSNAFIIGKYINFSANLTASTLMYINSLYNVTFSVANSSGNTVFNATQDSSGGNVLAGYNYTFTNYGDYTLQVIACNRNQECTTTAKQSFYLFSGNMSLVSLLPSKTKLAENTTLILQASSVENNYLISCNFTIINTDGSKIINIQNGTSTDKLYWNSTYYINNITTQYNTTVICQDRFNQQFSLSYNYTPSYAFISNPATNETYSTVAQVNKTELKIINISVYDDSLGQITYAVTAAIDNPNNFTLSLSTSSIILNASETSSLPIKLSLSFNASESLLNGTYGGNITFTNATYGITKMISFNYGIYPPSGIPTVYDDIGTTECTSSFSDICAEFPIIELGASSTIKYIVKNTGYYTLDKCTPQFSNELNGVSWITFSNSNFSLVVNATQNITVTFNPLSITAKTYSGYFYINCSDADLGGNPYAGNPINWPFVLVDVNQAAGSPGGGGGGASPKITIITPGGNWTMQTEQGVGSYDLRMTKGSERVKNILFENLGIYPINLTLSCESSDESCQYVIFNAKQITLPASRDFTTSTFFTITLPSTVDVEEMNFNVIAVDNYNNRAIVSVKIGIGAEGIVLDIVNKFTDSKTIGGYTIPLFYVLTGFLSFFLVFLLSRYLIFGMLLEFGDRLAIIVSFIIAFFASVIIVAIL